MSFEKLKEGVDTSGRVLLSDMPTIGSLEILIPDTYTDDDSVINLAIEMSNACKEIYGITQEQMETYSQMAVKETEQEGAEVIVRYAQGFMLEAALDADGCIDTYYYKGFPVLRSQTYSTAKPELLAISKMLPIAATLPEGITVKSIRPSK